MMEILYAPQTQLLLNELFLRAKRAHKASRQLMVIVPAQASFLVESGIMEYCEIPGFMHIEVASFEKLVERTLLLAGGRTLSRVDGTGFAMLAKLAISRLGEELGVLGHKDPTLHVRAAELIWSLKNEMITPDDMLALADDVDSYIGKKVADVAKIYECMQAAAEGALFDTLDLEQYAARRFAQMESIAKSDVVFYGFDVLPKRRIETMMRLVTAARSATVLFEADEQEVMQKQWNSMQLIAAAAKGHGISVEMTPLCGQAPSGEMAHLFQNLYQYPAEAYPITPTQVHIATTKTKRQEVMYVAENILEMTCEQGYHMGDIAVLCGDTNPYAPLVKDIFSRAGIPFYLESKRALYHSNLACFMMSSLKIVTDGKWRMRDIEEFLKSGFCCQEEEADALLSYMREYGLRGYQCKSEFSYAVPELEELRASVFAPLLILERALKEHGFALGVKNYMEGLGIEAQILEQAVRAERLGFLGEARFLEQIYPAFLEVLDATAVLGQIPLAELTEVLEAGLYSKEVSIVPPMSDEVFVGDITHSIVGRKKVIHILGLNDGLIPALVDESGVITNYEVEALRAHLPNFPNRMAFEDQKPYIRKCFTLGEELYLSYSEEAGMPSYLVERLCRIFPQLKVEDASGVLLRAKQASLPSLAQELRLSVEGKGTPSQLTAMYLAEDRDHLAEMIGRMDYDNAPGTLSAGTARAVFGTLKTSVSRIESYYHCSYKHFMDYGIRPTELRAFEEDAASAGTYVHDLMEEFTASIARENLSWKEISDEQLEHVINNSADALMEDHNRGIFKRKRFAFTEKRLREEVTLAAKAVRTQLADTDVVVAAGEAGFGGDIYHINTAYGKLSVRGRIDRIDEAKAEDTTYLRVVDYKTGRQKFDLTELFYGVNLQLLVYLMAAQNRYRMKREKSEPAGGFYFSIDLPYIGEEESEELRLQKFRMNGFIVESAEAAAALDSRQNGKLQSMNAQLSPDGVKEAANTFTKEELHGLFQFTSGMIVSAVEEMYQGKLEIAPLMLGGEVPCRYCPYLSICMFDDRLAGNRLRKTKTIEKQELLEKAEYDGEN